MGRGFAGFLTDATEAWNNPDDTRSIYAYNGATISIAVRGSGGARALQSPAPSTPVSTSTSSTGPAEPATSPTEALLIVGGIFGAVAVVVGAIVFLSPSQETRARVTFPAP